MKRTSPDSTVNTGAAAPNRRALIAHHDNHELLASPEVAAFLDNQPLDGIDYRKIERKLVRADERALLVELIQATGHDSVTLCETDNFSGGVPELEPGMLTHIMEHLPRLPSVSSLEVTGAVLKAIDCMQLQQHLNSPGCPLQVLSFLNCHFTDAQIAFPRHAPTVHTLTWSVDVEDASVGVPPDATPQLMTALVSWTGLQTLKLAGLGAPLNYPVLAPLLLAQPGIARLRLYTDMPNDPVTLFEALASNRTGVRDLTFEAALADNPQHNEVCFQRMVDCLSRNETLEVLKVPGLLVCTEEAQQRLVHSLDNNRSLTSLSPLNPFDLSTPRSLSANRKRQLWFSRDFILGAAEAFMQLMGEPRQLGGRVAAALSTTPTSRTYCGPVMALLCKATHAEAVKLRSAGLREAIKIHMKTNDQYRCLHLIRGLVEFHIDLLPVDKQAVVSFARERNLMNFLPAGYAG
jgi:hypothetical protein